MQFHDQTSRLTLVIRRIRGGECIYSFMIKLYMAFVRIKFLALLTYQRNFRW